MRRTYRHEGEHAGPQQRDDRRGGGARGHRQPGGSVQTARHERLYVVQATTVSRVHGGYLNVREVRPITAASSSRYAAVSSICF